LVQSEQYEFGFDDHILVGDPSKNLSNK